MTRRLVSPSIIAADGIRLTGVEFFITLELRATGRFRGTSEPIDGRHLVAVGSVIMFTTVNKKIDDNLMND